MCNILEKTGVTPNVLRNFANKILLTAVLIALGLHTGTHVEAKSATQETSTPIKYLVVIYMENASFDLVFATYPKALNPPGVPHFTPRPDTPGVNGLTGTLIERNPNETKPFRIARKDSFTCDQDHDYTREQKARNGGLMNKFVRYDAEPPYNMRQFCSRNEQGHWDTVMGYFDGNTVTALWNYAQHYAMSDNFFASNSGESTRGHLNLTAGDTYGVICAEQSLVIGDAVPSCGPTPASTNSEAPSNGNMATFNIDSDPYWDICSNADGRYIKGLVAMDRPTIAHLLNERGVTWGWFQGGFKLDGQGKCTSSHPLVAFDLATGVDPATDPYKILDYVPHHNPFQFYRDTANPSHLTPTSVEMIGRTDRANHLYDIEHFWQAADAGNLPSVSFLKPAKYQNMHPGYSNPLDAQVFIVESINRLMNLPEWKEMAVFIAWDDSDGWYDHVMPPIVNKSATKFDYLCGESSDGPSGRCGYGPRLPFIVVSPYAKENYVSSVLNDQTSIARFIEDNWLSGKRISDTSFDNFANPLDDLFDFTGPRSDKLILEPLTGQPVNN